MGEEAGEGGEHTGAGRVLRYGVLPAVKSLAAAAEAAAAAGGSKRERLVVVVHQEAPVTVGWGLEGCGGGRGGRGRRRVGQVGAASKSQLCPVPTPALLPQEKYGEASPNVIDQYAATVVAPVLREEGADAVVYDEAQLTNTHTPNISGMRGTQLTTMQVVSDVKLALLRCVADRVGVLSCGMAATSLVHERNFTTRDILLSVKAFRAALPPGARRGMKLARLRHLKHAANVYAYTRNRAPLRFVLELGAQAAAVVAATDPAAAGLSPETYQQQLRRVFSSLLSRAESFYRQCPELGFTPGDKEEGWRGVKSASLDNLSVEGAKLQHRPQRRRPPLQCQPALAALLWPAHRPTLVAANPLDMAWTPAAGLPKPLPR
ncbi:hypothetical protein ABPG75_005507 [Micractinium tetrahymenae]